MNDTQRNALTSVLNAIVETVNESGAMGAPSGILYAALMAQGCTLSQFTGLMSILERTGKVVKRGDCYFPA